MRSLWQQFLDRCIETRLDVELFTTYVELLKTQEPLPASQVAQIFLAPREHNDYALDPRVTRYVQTLLSLELFNVPTLLRGLWKVSSFRLQEEEGRVEDKETKNKKAEGRVDGKAGKVWLNSYTTEETMFYRITKCISSGAAPRDLQETVELINACIQWMETVISAPQGAHQMLNLAPTRAAEMAAQHMALGTLVVSVVENNQVQHALGKRAVPKPVRGHLSKALGGFVPLVLQSSPQIAGRLEIFRTETLAAFESPEAKEPKGDADKDIEEILQGGLDLRVDSMVVEEIPVVNTRVGLYVYLNALLVARPLIDDSSIFSYLHNQYQASSPHPRPWIY
ncbi:mediator complex subunit Med5 [Diplocarpon rosae]|nr:mediator complex subunit Med5 [Diplocarpon rosae]